MSISPESLPAAPKRLVDNSADLQEVCDHLRASGRFAFDTEFIGEATYEPVLCLVQVATTKRVELIDPFAFEDLSPLWQLMADPKIEKIVHAGDQDLEIAWLGGKLAPANVFDTQIAAGMIGSGYPLALWRLVEQYCDIELSKSQTYSAWDRRPLSSSQFSYAIDDVRYLPAIFDAMTAQIESLGHTAWMREACSDACENAAAVIDARQLFIRIKGASGLSGKALAVLREITVQREQIAFEHNLPPRTIMRDEVLIDIALRTPKRDADLAGIRGISRDTVVSFGDQIIASVARGTAITPDQYPVFPAASDDSTEVKRMTETLVAAGQLICLGQSVTPSIVFAQADMLALARRLDQKKSVDDLNIMQGWRKECLGDKLAAMIHGELQIHVHMTPEIRIRTMN